MTDESQDRTIQNHKERQPGRWALVFGIVCLLLFLVVFGVSVL